MARNPTERLVRRASCCGLQMIEVYEMARLSCIFYNQDRLLSRPHSDLPEDEADAFRETRWASFLKCHEALSHAYNRVAGWWVAHETPSFESKAASVLEGILWWSTRLLVHLSSEDPHGRPGHLDAAVKLVIAYCPKMPTDEVIALLRTETRRLLDRLPHLIPQPAGPLCDAQSIEERCDVEAAALLPEGWHQMTVQEKIAAVAADEPAMSNPYNRLLNRAVPSWDREKKTLKVGSETVKTFRLGPPPKNQAKILEAMQAAGWPENQEVAVDKLDGYALRNAASEIHTYLRRKGIIFRSLRSSHVMWERGAKRD